MLNKTLVDAFSWVTLADRQKKEERLTHKWLAFYTQLVIVYDFPEHMAKVYGLGTRRTVDEVLERSKSNVIPAYAYQVAN